MSTPWEGRAAAGVRPITPWPVARRLHHEQPMAPRLIRRRRDGLVEIRSARARDLVLTSDAMVLLGMLAGWVLFTVTLVLSLVFDPPLLLVAGWFILALFVEQRRAPAGRLVAARATPPIGPAA